MIRLASVLLVIAAPALGQGDPPASRLQVPVPEDLPGNAWWGTATLGDDVQPVHLQRDGAVLRLSLPWRATYGYPVAASLEERTLRLDTPWPEQVWTLQVGGDGSLRGRWSVAGTEVPIELSRVPPAPLPRERAVSFEAEDGVHLAGALVLPARGEGPFVTVVMGHGSAPDTRRTQHYLGRARWFARNGVATFVWDKRGFGESGGSPTHGSDTAFADHRAAVAAARRLAEVDGDWIVAAGFSRGGWTAPMLAARDPRIAGVLVGSAPGIDAAEQNVYSLVTRLPEEDCALGAELLREVYEYYRTGEGHDALVARLEAEAHAHVVDSAVFRRLLFSRGALPPAGVDPAAYAFMFEDPLPYWRELQVPVLAMWGDHDRSVPPLRSRDRIAAALAESGADDTVLRVFEGATHGLMRATDPDAAPRWTRTAPGFQELVAGWLRRRVDERARRGGAEAAERSPDGGAGR